MKSVTALQITDSSAFYIAANFIAIAAVSGYLINVDIAAPPAAFRREGVPVPILVEVSGRVQKLYVGEGTEVRLGDPLVQLDAREFIRKKNALELRIHWMELQPAGRRTGLFPLYRELHQMQLDLGRYTITSPLDGRITSLAQLRAGEMLRSGTAIAVGLPRGRAPD